MTNPIRVQPDTVYGSANRDLLCDVYLPDVANANGAATLLFHGGGWRGGDRSMMKPAATAFAERGFVAVAVGYRLTAEAPWPAQIHDTKTAIRWLRANAGRFGVAPDKITLTGFSAGAHLALLAAGTADTGILRSGSDNTRLSERVAAVAAFFPPTRLTTRHRSVLGISAEEVGAASPIEHISAAFPPTILLHGTGDGLVPHSESVRMFDALAAAGALVDLRLYAGLPHEFVQLPGCLNAAMDDVAAFFERTVINRASFDAAVVEAQRVWEERSRSFRAPAPA